MWIVLSGVSVFAFLFGLANLTGSTATIGLGCIGAAGVFAIWARLVQAASYARQKLDLRTFNYDRDPTEPAR